MHTPSVSNHSLLYITCYQSRHRQNIISIFPNVQMGHSYNQAWRTLAVWRRHDWETRWKDRNTIVFPLTLFLQFSRSNSFDCFDSKIISKQSLNILQGRLKRCRHAKHKVTQQRSWMGDQSIRLDNALRTSHTAKIRQGHATALIKKATSISETSVNFYHITRRNIPEDKHLQLSLHNSYLISFPRGWNNIR
jgi:hypothetical protein